MPATCSEAAMPARRNRRRSAGPKPRPILRMVVSVCIVVSLAVGAWVIHLARTLPDLDGLEAAPRSGEVVLVDRNGRTIARRGTVSEDAIQADDLPEALVDAVLAVEDRRFYGHFGVDIIGTGRAALANLQAGRVVQGGSTITQQLAKNLFLTSDRTITRKMQEMMLALWLERRFTKDEILALYLNRVYFGAGAWGAEAASRRYFGKPADDLAIGEAALLAGLLKAPSRYAPTNDATRASVRATVVLDLMLASGRITEAERIAAAQVPIRVSRGASSPGAGWFADWIIPQVRELSEGYTGDLIVRTTLDVNAQRAAEAALRLGLSTPEWARGASEGALIALDGAGGVAAMVGGSDYREAPFNRSVNALRQPGSAFKPFVYLTAFEAGYGPDDIFEDAPVRYGDWAPENYNGRYEGEMTLERAFARSSNSIAVQVSEAAGRGWVVRAARRMGIDSPIQNTHSLALGSYEVTPIELAAAYLPFMNGGRAVDPHAILTIETADGTLLFQHQRVQGDLVLAGRVLGQMEQIFSATVDYGTGRGAQVAGRTVRGKTGTTNDSRDAWFAGWSEGLTAVVWMGNDDFSATKNAVGGAGPARVFARFIEATPVYPASLDSLLADRSFDPVASLLQGDAEMPAPAGDEQLDDAEGGEDGETDPLADLLTRLDTGNRP
ncbi:PBP1A family penicillin-binding protein [Maricaulaceae bacterium EIL42A08]|nr:PBP1A family penicillin-binding protein [Maricaulaceae bacterium EIL42A08]